MSFIVAFVPGVVPGKWGRIWNERETETLELRPLADAEALAALRDGTAAMALLRHVPADDEALRAIPLYREQPVVVAPKDHAIADLARVDLADLAGETVLDGEGADTVELVAANVGLAIMPQGVARAHSRRDVIARPLDGADDTGISLVWRVGDAGDDRVQAFIGIVRGRTANSSRGASGTAEAEALREAKAAQRAAKAAKKKAKQDAAAKSGTAAKKGARPTRPGRPGGRSGGGASRRRGSGRG
ncbi:LysR family transcriptional regulator substrate-binding protein [Schumannella soli]|uniref:LysR family transcriptional regulator substrate-binding protein n=1 Tax=Schumannella soli TaxID=2590779 RepID=A0A506Y376_9MICO|nr:LysR family transcriptional regulator substrate-binding protein [Schumannella soli]TPW76040.1 LysR family transcriptional regulator substrate-binding protein [Schumannella soli]